MKKRSTNLLLFTTLLLSCILTCVQADEPARTIQRDNDGFCISLRNVSEVTLTQHLLELQQDLETQVNLLREEMKRKSFKVIDTLIAVVMPGGLVYAKLRMDSYKKSKRAVSLVSDELTQISSDLNSFQSDRGDLMLANME